jgi:hypothetical protein
MQALVQIFHNKFYYDHSNPRFSDQKQRVAKKKPLGKKGFNAVFHHAMHV